MSRTGKGASTHDDMDKSIAQGFGEMQFKQRDGAVQRALDIAPQPAGSGSQNSAIL